MNTGFGLERCLRRWLLVPGVLLAGNVLGFAGPPEWLLEIASAPTPEVSSDSPAVVLLNETVLTVDTGARASTRHRHVIRILNPAGKSEARGGVWYVDKSDSVRGCEAWLIRAGKAVKLPRWHDWVDRADSESETIYSEYRARVVNYTDVALPGDVFGYEARVDGPMLYLQRKPELGSRFPLVVDRFELQIPAGWTLSTVVKGSVTPSVSVSADRRTTVWELRDRPYRPNETWVPLIDAAEADVMVTINPGPEQRAEPHRGFSTWGEAVDWVNRLNAGQCDADPALVDKVRTLVAGCPDDLSKMRALGSHVQALRYVEVSKDIGIGFGCRARKATDVLSRGWGDCKDKANLLRAMLREAGIRANLALAKPKTFGDVYPEWPSPGQFNHAIVAIEVDATIKLPAVVPVEGRGRLLFFDPTDPVTMLGDLPEGLQGSNVLVCAEGCEGLTALPLLPADPEYLVETKVELSLAADGSVSGRRSSGGAGQAGARKRDWLWITSKNDLNKRVTEGLSENLRGVAVTDVTSTDDRVSGRCFVTIEFSAPNYIQFLQGGLALARLDVLHRGSVPKFVDKERRMPLKIQPVAEHDEVTLGLPAGFTVDELPPKAVLAGPYGSYESSFEWAGRSVVRHRKFALIPQPVPPGAYAHFQEFLSDVAKADRTAVVLRKPNGGGG
jgi:hypothetical protein